MITSFTCRVLTTPTGYFLSVLQKVISGQQVTRKYFRQIDKFFRQPLESCVIYLLGLQGYIMTWVDMLGDQHICPEEEVVSSGDRIFVVKCYLAVKQKSMIKDGLRQQENENHGRIMVRN
ncbi:hypothetical protein PoB_001213100 [Plakobranchus ocellatus]|uniref:Uncharacterized protein n=1 Tax=Plakobranchus ocellatus TaxID=259542 RepID=A0AAV3YE81_9GAST|nr:hypothetical protein PoB_001213100 [Plakobranchus ocellatus]